MCLELFGIWRNLGRQSGGQLLLRNTNGSHWPKGLCHRAAGPCSSIDMTGYISQFPYLPNQQLCADVMQVQWTLYMHLR